MKLFRSGALALVLTLGACSDPSGPKAPALPPSQILTRIALTPASIIVAVGDSVQATVHAFDALGETLSIPDSTTVIWETSDAQYLRVTPDGMLHADKATLGDAQVTAIATWTFHGVTRSESIFVTITATRQPIAGIRIVGKDSTRTSLGQLNQASPCCGVSVIAVDANGDSLGLLRVPLKADPSYTSGQVLIAYFGPLGLLFGLGQYYLQTRLIGDYWLYAESNVYGVPVSDSARFTGLYPADVTVKIQQDDGATIIKSTLDKQMATVQPCAIVRFDNTSYIPVDVVFDDPAKASGCQPGQATGNITAINPNESQDRWFPATGQIRWTVRPSGTSTVTNELSGTVIMREP